MRPLSCNHPTELWPNHVLFLWETDFHKPPGKTGNKGKEGGGERRDRGKIKGEKEGNGGGARELRLCESFTS